MSVSVSMPQLGESVTEGTVTRWLKKEGDHVEADEPLLEVSTDKVDTEIPSPVSGILRGITVAEDETVAVGAELAVIDEDARGEAAEAAARRPSRPRRRRRRRGGPGAGTARRPSRGVPAGPGRPRSIAPTGPGAGVPAGHRPLRSTSRPTSRPGVPATRRHRRQTTSPVGAAGQPARLCPRPSMVTPPPRRNRARRPRRPPSQAPAAPTADAAAAPPSCPAPQAAPAQPRTRRAARRRAPRRRRPAPARRTAEPAARLPRGRRPRLRLPPAAEGPYVTPLVSKLAAEHGVDLASVTGTGVGGRIRKQDVLEAARAVREASARAPRPPPPLQAPTVGRPGASGGRAGRRRSGRSAPARPRQPAPARPVVPSTLRGTTERHVPGPPGHRPAHGRVAADLRPAHHGGRGRRHRDSPAARAAKADFEAREGVKLSFLPFFALATVEALKAHPQAERGHRHRGRHR